MQQYKIYFNEEIVSGGGPILMPIVPIPIHAHTKLLKDNHS